MPSSTNYINAQKESGFKVGDTVRILRVPQCNELGWGKHPDPVGRKHQIGHAGRILSVDKNWGFKVQTPDDRSEFFWPYFVLEPVNKFGEMAPKSKDLDKKTVVPDEPKGKTVVIISGMAVLAGSFSADEIDKIVACMKAQ